jgi:hypothetical protein
MRAFGAPLDATAPKEITVPAVAADAAYNVMTFNSTAIGTTAGTLQSFNFFRNSEPSNASVQNADGSVTITGSSGNNYNADLSSCTYDSSEPEQFRGLAFGGGFYAEATFSFTGTPEGGNPTPAFWFNDIEHMAGGVSTQWQGQPSGYDHWGELDVIEANIAGNTAYGGAFFDWYGVLPSPSKVHLNVGSPFQVGSIDWAAANKYAVLWVPATATTLGYLKFFFNDAQVGHTAYWNQYDASRPPPPKAGATAGSIMDVRHWALIIGNGNKRDAMKVRSVRIWQVSDAHNIAR